MAAVREPRTRRSRFCEPRANAHVRQDSGRISLAVRTGDTPPEERRLLRTDPPDILLTTPESLAILLAQPDLADLFRIHWPGSSSTKYMLWQDRNAVPISASAWNGWNGWRADRYSVSACPPRPRRCPPRHAGWSAPVDVASLLPSLPRLVGVCTSIR